MSWTLQKTLIIAIDTFICSIN